MRVILEAHEVSKILGDRFDMEPESVAYVQVLETGSQSEATVIRVVIDDPYAIVPKDDDEDDGVSR